MHLSHLFAITTTVFKARKYVIKKCLALTHSYLLTPLGNKPFENTVGKGGIARIEQFLLYPVVSTCLENFLLFSSDLELSSAGCFKLNLSKILSSGNGLIHDIYLFCTKAFFNAVCHPGLYLQIILENFLFLVMFSGVVLIYKHSIFRNI